MARNPQIYTRKGDDGTTDLLYGGPRVAKNAPMIEANGVVDEAQAVIGVARSEAPPGGALDALLIDVERDLWVLMAEMATAPDNRHKLVAGKSMVTPEMVSVLEGHIDDLNEHFDMPSAFVVPGQNRVSALLDMARTVVRRGERLVVTAMPDVDSQVGPYLNRLSDLLWTTARWQEGEHLLSKTVKTKTPKGTLHKTGGPTPGVGAHKASAPGEARAAKKRSSPKKSKES